MFSGMEKLISPYQNFLYVIQQYQVLIPFFEEVTARVFPWVELILGVFLLLGLWLKWTLRGVMALFLVFVGIVGQAILRGLPIDECGCFGSLISLPLSTVMAFDFSVLILIGVLSKKIGNTEYFSLDRYFSQ